MKNVIKNKSSLPVFKYAVFDFDGTISLLRKNWREVLYEVMMEAIASENINLPFLQDKIIEFIDSSSGQSTLYQMKFLEKIIKKYGNSSNNNRLVAEDYKKIYNDRIKKLVDERIREMKDGELNPDNLLVPGVSGFIELLKSLNMLLYIASGTDRNDVMKEASYLGVDHHFEKIFAPDTSFPNFSKHWLIGQIINWHKVTAKEILVIGDGPVEMSAAKKYGCFSIGIESIDNPSDKRYTDKRSILSNAGADIIFPDFLDVEKLKKIIFSR